MHLAVVVGGSRTGFDELVVETLVIALEVVVLEELTERTREPPPWEARIDSKAAWSQIGNIRTDVTGPKRTNVPACKLTRLMR